MTKIDLSVMTFDSAKELTAQIRVATEDLWQLVVKAHDEKAWAALAYPDFGEYCRQEFSMSRAKAYRLLDFGKVQEALSHCETKPGQLQVVELAKLDTTEEQIEAIDEACKAAAPTGKPPTHEHTKAAVAKVRAKRNGTAAAAQSEPPPHAPDPTDPKDEPPGPNDPEPNYPALSLLRMNWDAAKGDERLSAIEYFWANMAVTFQAAVLKYFWLKASPEQRDEFRKYQEAQP